jgi:hypothetical protein
VVAHVDRPDVKAMNDEPNNRNAGKAWSGMDVSICRTTSARALSIEEAADFPYAQRRRGRVVKARELGLIAE